MINKLMEVLHALMDQILGVGMSDKVWEATIAHAKTCPVGGKLYLYPGSQCSLLLNSICEVVGIVYGHATFALQELSKPQRVSTTRILLRNSRVMRITDALISCRSTCVIWPKRHIKIGAAWKRPMI